MSGVRLSVRKSTAWVLLAEVAFFAFISGFHLGKMGIVGSTRGWILLGAGLLIFILIIVSSICFWIWTAFLALVIGWAVFDGIDDFGWALMAALFSIAVVVGINLTARADTLADEVVVVD